MIKSHTNLQRALAATREALTRAPDPATRVRLEIRAAMLARLVKP